MEAAMTAINMIAQGKRNMVCGEIPTAVNQFQEACKVLSKSYGETAKECAEAYYQYGRALLDLARMETGVLGNALQGVPEDEEGEKSADEQFEKGDMEAEDRYKLRAEVVDAMSEKELASEKEKEQKGDKDKEKDDEKNKEKDDEKDKVKKDDEKDKVKKEDEKDKVKKEGDKDEKKEEKKDEEAMDTDNGTKEVSPEIEKKDEEKEKKDSEKKKKDSEKDEKKVDEEKSSKKDEKDKEKDEKDGELKKKEKKSEGDSSSTKNSTEDEEEGEEGTEEEGTEEDEDESEAVETAEEGDTSQDEGSQGAKEGEENADDISNLQLAWEMLELAKVIYLKDEDKAAKLRAADAYLKLGEVSLETEQYTQSISDFTECLNIQKSVLEPDDRSLAETHYQLGLAYSFNKEYDQSIDSYRAAVKVMESKIDALQKKLDENKFPEPKEGSFDDTKKLTEQEINDLKEILPDIRGKVEEVKEERRQIDELKKMAKEGMSVITESLGLQKPEEKPKDEPKKPVSDISHLIRRKRKPDEEEEPVEAKKTRQENGSGDAPPKVNGVDKDAMDVDAKKAETDAAKPTEAVAS